jgi:glucose-1-phosphate thymidylyltransferase
MIYYPLSTLMLAGIRNILIITTPQDQKAFRDLLGDGRSLGISLSYEMQNSPEGLAQAFHIGKDFIDGEDIALILGDNIFYGTGLGRELTKCSNPKGAVIFGYQVSDPQRYGVAEIGELGEVLSLEEKPKSPKSNLAIPGLYFFDSSVCSRANLVEKSHRGEYEITSILESYRREGKLTISVLPRGTSWMDCGTVRTLNDAGNYIRVIEERQSLKVGVIEEIAWRNGWISSNELRLLAKSFRGNEYGEYLQRLVN